MRILADTSVWSLAFRKGGPSDHPAVKQLQQHLLQGSEIVLIGMILQEILQGFRAEATFEKLVEYLQAFPFIQLTRLDFIAAANLHRRCAARGITVSSSDCQIAAAALAYQCHLLTTDQDFQHFTKVCPLQLV